MGLAGAFVFSVDRRGLLAVLSIAASVSYALLAGAAATGLKDAQAALGAGVQDPDVVVVRDGYAAFRLEELSAAPDQGLSILNVEGRTFYTAVIAAGGGLGADEARAGRAVGLAKGSTLVLAARNLTVVDVAVLPGAAPYWFEVGPETLRALGGSTDSLHVATYGNLDPPATDALRDAGFQVLEAPAALGFYVAGSRQLVDVVRATAAASALVVGLLASAFVHLELRARRASYATLQLFAGPRVVRRLAAARGITLVVAGHVVALLATQALLLLLRRAGAAPLALPGSYVAYAMGLTLAGGLLGLAPALWRASRRLGAQHLQAIAPRPRMPRALRPTLVSWRSLVPLVAAGIVLSASLGVIFGIVDMPRQLFGTEEGQIVAAATGNPLRGTVSAFYGDHLDEAEGIRAASPEIYAPTVIEGRPVMVRGVSWPDLLELDDVRVVQGREPRALGEVALGARLVDRLPTAVGATLWTPSAYTRSALPLTVVGRVEAPGLLADEALVTLETARALTDLAPAEVTLVRVRPEPVAATQPPGAALLPTAIEVTRIELAPPEPVPQEPAEAVVTVVNFSPFPAARTLTLQVDGVPVSDARAALEGHSEGQVRIPFRVPLSGFVTLHVNPTAQFGAASPAYALEAPTRALLGHNLTVRVSDRDGQAAPNVRVQLDGQTATTNATGHAVLLPIRAGNRTLVAEGAAGRAARLVLVIAPQDLDRSRLVYHQIVGPTQMVAGTWSGTALVENVGGVLYEGALPLLIDGNATDTTSVHLRPGVLQRVTLEIPLAPGEHRIGPLEAEIAIRVIDPTQAATEPGAAAPGAATLEQLLAQRRERAAQGAAPTTDPATAFFRDTFENLDAALTLVVLATVVHAGLVVAVATHREAEAHAATIGVLAALGADRRALRGRVLREYGLVGAVAGLLGAGLGVGAAWLAATAGFLQGFGHGLLPRADWEFQARLAAVLLITIWASALVAVEAVRGRTVRALLAEGPRRAARPPLAQLLGDGG